jgi:hypothetical protein
MNAKPISNAKFPGNSTIEDIGYKLPAINNIAVPAAHSLAL